MQRPAWQIYSGYSQHTFAGKLVGNRVKHLRSRCFGAAGAKSYPRPEFGFEVTNEGSVAYARVA